MVDFIIPDAIKHVFFIRFIKDLPYRTKVGQEKSLANFTKSPNFTYETSYNSDTVISILIFSPFILPNWFFYIFAKIFSHQAFSYTVYIYALTHRQLCLDCESCVQALVYLYSFNRFHWWTQSMLFLFFCFAHHWILILNKYFNFCKLGTQKC